MAWTEPLTVVSAYRRPVAQFFVRDGRGVTVANSIGKINRSGTTGIMGDIEVNADGTPRQRMRASILIYREAFRVADSLGITQCHIEILPTASRLFALAFGRGRADDTREVFTGPLHDLRSALLDRTDENGDTREARARAN